MSADNWDACPKCGAGDPENLEGPFREDYELGFLKGRFFVDYNGECQECGYEKKFNHTEGV